MFGGEVRVFGGWGASLSYCYNLLAGKMFSDLHSTRLLRY